MRTIAIVLRTYKQTNQFQFSNGDGGETSERGEEFVSHRLYTIVLLQWNQYLKCDGLPDPASCPQMNTYLHLWEKKIQETDIEEAAARTREIINVGVFSAIHIV